MDTVRKTEDADWITLAEAARMLGEARLTVLGRSVKGELVAKHIAGRTVVSRAGVEQLLANREL
jgi:hypothetical protein